MSKCIYKIKYEQFFKYKTFNNSIDMIGFFESLNQLITTYLSLKLLVHFLCAFHMSKMNKIFFISIIFDLEFSLINEISSKLSH